MIKLDIVHEIGNLLHLSVRESKPVVDAIIESIKETICKNGRLEIRNLGVFQIQLRQARVGRNPKTKEEYPITERKVITFRASKKLLEDSEKSSD